MNNDYTIFDSDIRAIYGYAAAIQSYTLHLGDVENTLFENIVLTGYTDIHVTVLLTHNPLQLLSHVLRKQIETKYLN